MRNNQRSSILHQLLSEDRDPFSRAFLRADMLIPMPKTKAAILAWAAAKKAQSLSPSKLLEDNTAAALNNVIKIKEIEIKELREKIEPAKPKPDELTGALAPLDSDILHEDDDELARALMKFFTGVLNRITQEDGSLPGEPLGTFLGIVYFLVIPTVMFIVISVVVAIATVDRRKNKSSSLTRID